MHVCFVCVSYLRRELFKTNRYLSVVDLSIDERIKMQTSWGEKKKNQKLF